MEYIGTAVLCGQPQDLIQSKKASDRPVGLEDVRLWSDPDETSSEGV